MFAWLELACLSLVTTILLSHLLAMGWCKLLDATLWLWKSDGTWSLQLYCGGIQHMPMWEGTVVEPHRSGWHVSLHTYKPDEFIHFNGEWVEDEGYYGGYIHELGDLWVNYEWMEYKDWKSYGQVVLSKRWLQLQLDHLVGFDVDWPHLSFRLTT